MSQSVDTVTLSAVSTQYTQVQEYYSLPEQATAVVKGLRRSCKEGGEREHVIHMMNTTKRLAERTYDIQSRLGTLGAGSKILIILDHHLDDAEVVVACLQALLALISADTNNKIAVGTSGGCNSVIKIGLKYLPTRHPEILHLCCLMMTDLGNAKFPAMIERVARYDSVVGGMILNTRSADLNLAPSADFSTFDSADEEGYILENEHAVPPMLGEHQLWDNRTELCNAGACEFLFQLLEQEVKEADKVILYKRRSLILPQMNEEVVEACCDAIASLCTNDMCAKKFGGVEIFQPLLAFIKGSTKWSLQQCSSWAIVNLCADFKSGNREKFGEAGACDQLCSSINYLTLDISTNIEANGFHRLLETLIWALHNVCYGSDENQKRMWSIPTLDSIFQLRREKWLKPGAKQKLDRLHRDIHDFRVRSIHDFRVRSKKTEEDGKESCDADAAESKISEPAEEKMVSPRNEEEKC